MEDLLNTLDRETEAAVLAAEAEAVSAADASEEETEAAEEMTLEDMAEAFEVRAQTYGFLSRLFTKEVDEDLLAELTSMRYPVESGNALMNDGYYHMAKYLSNEWADPITKLAIDYSATFLGSGIDAYSAAYPFESVYTSEKRLLMQGARDEVLAIYRANSLEKAGDWTIGEDHIAVELEFMRILTARCIRALRTGNEDKAMHLIATQQNFLADHLGAWVPVFTTDIRRFAKTQFYVGVAELLDGFLESEAELLADLIVEDEDGETADQTAGASASDAVATAESEE